MSNPLRWRLLIGLLAVPLVLAGCAARRVHGGEVVFTGAVWVAAVSAAVGLLLIPVGWWARRPERLGPGYARALMFGGPLVAAAVTWATFANRVTVSPDHFAARTSFGTSTVDVCLGDVREIEVATVLKKIHTGTVYTTQELTFVLKGGSRRTVAMGTLVRAALPDLREQAKARGIPVTETTHGG